MNERERFGLSRDRFIQWKASIKFAEPISDDDARKDHWYLAKAVMVAFKDCRRANMVLGTANVIDGSMGKLIPFLNHIRVEYKVLPDALTGIVLNLEIQESKEDMATENLRINTPNTLLLSLDLQNHYMVGAIMSMVILPSHQSETPTAMLEHGIYYTGFGEDCFSLSEDVHVHVPKHTCLDWRRTMRRYKDSSNNEKYWRAFIQDIHVWTCLE